MGREIKRVPVDFNWPLDKTWHGFINPYYKYRQRCPDCDGSGLNPATKQLEDDWYDNDGFGVRWTYAYGFAPDGTQADRPPWLIIGNSRRWEDKLEQDEVNALMEEGRLSDFTHPHWYRKDETGQWRMLDRSTRNKLGDWQPCDPPPMPTAEQVNEWSQHGMGHDAINRWICVKRRAMRLGVYGKCEACGGDGDEWVNPITKAAHNTWKPVGPPAGDGWQLWEDVSEGSPISPVFDSANGLVDWLIGEGYSQEAAVNFVMGNGYAPSALIVDGQFYNDIESCAVMP